MDMEEKLEVFREFLDCSDVMLSQFDKEMRLLSEHAEQAELETLFEIGGGRQMIHDYCETNVLPGFCSDSVSLLWLETTRF